MHDWGTDAAQSIARFLVFALIYFAWHKRGQGPSFRLRQRPARPRPSPRERVRRRARPAADPRTDPLWDRWLDG